MKQNKIFRLMLTLVLALSAWTTASADAPGYELSATSDHGTVTFTVGSNTNATTAPEGATVTIVVTPDDGYDTGTVTATASMGTDNMQARRRALLIKDIEVTQAMDGGTPIANTYTITMPAANVEVGVTYNKIIQATWIEDIAEQTYTGSAITPGVTVKDGTTELEQGTDYTVSYSNNINVALSTAATAPMVTVTGHGNYSGAVLKTFTINKKEGSISYTTTELTKAFGDDAFTNALTKNPPTGTELGTVTYAVSAETKGADCVGDHVVTVDGETGEVTITGYGTATITATVTDGDNCTYSGMTGYNEETHSASVSYDLTVTKGTITATASGYNGSYDGSNHGITVSVAKPTSGYEVKYGTAQGTYDLTSSPTFKVAGTNQTVYYQVTANNYETKTGSATVVISTKVTEEGGVKIEESGGTPVVTIDDTGSNLQGVTLPENLTVNLTYSRQLSESDNAYTVCLPYPPSTTNLTYYTLTGVNGSTLHFDEIEGNPVAYTPYLVVAGGATEIGKSNVTATTSKTVDNNSSAGSYVMKGTISGIKHDDAIGLYILQSGNRWGVIVADKTAAYVPPCHAYIEATSAGARETLESSFGDDSTGIQNIRTVDRDGTERWYDLNGRRIEKPATKGVFIQNGQVVVVK